ncbi:MAG: hypothetical protein QM756_09850 [Polyangiaceae bacterium]
MIAAACFLEALANEAFACVAATGPLSTHTKSLSPEVRSRIVDLLQFVDKPSVASLDRFRAFLRPCGVLVDLGQEPWQSAMLLFQLRNALVHARPIDTGDLIENPHELEKKLVSRFSHDGTRPYPLNPQYEEMGEANPFFPDRLLGSGCCNWAIDTAEAVADRFAQSTGLAPWWQLERS